MESQPQNPEFRNNPENFHPCISYISVLILIKLFQAVHTMYIYLIKYVLNQTNVKRRCVIKGMHCI